MTGLRFQILQMLGRYIFPRYRFKWPQMLWWDDSGFNGYLKNFSELNQLNSDRRWMLSQLLRLVVNIPGDTAECGVYRGAGSYLICDFCEKYPSHPRTHFAFDSFEGLSVPVARDGDYWNRGDLACDLSVAQEMLRQYKNISWQKGWIPETFASAANRSFAFLHIDVDLYEPTRDSIEFFYPRMRNGGIILCDDYGFTSCPGATLAIDEFLADKPEKMISLCSGGGFLVKGCATAPLI